MSEDEVTRKTNHIVYKHCKQQKSYYKNATLSKEVDLLKLANTIREEKVKKKKHQNKWPSCGFNSDGTALASNILSNLIYTDNIE